MTISALIEAVLLAIAATASIGAGIGVLVMPTPYARLHYAGLVTTVAAPACAVAVAIAEGLWPAGAKALLVSLAMIVTGPVVTHATARAARAQETNGSSEPEP